MVDNRICFLASSLVKVDIKKKPTFLYNRHYHIGIEKLGWGVGCP
jgi:hypothetical protein